MSEDSGKSWEKAKVPDHHYTQFHQVGNAIFALGEGGYIARSTDGGREWKEIFYCEDFLDTIPWGDVGSCDCYGLTVHDGRIYIANFVYLGVMYSDDMGDTWHALPQKGMEIEEEGLVMADYLYNIMSFGGSLYAYSINNVYRYDETEEGWEVMVEGSNFLTVLTQHRGQLVAGRGTPNDSFEVNFLEKTTDGITWEGVGRPKDFVHNNIRSLAADESILVAGTANNGIFVTSDFGKNWEHIIDGMALYDNHPGVYLWPVALQTDDEFIYAAFYNPMQNDVKDSGIWRYPKAEFASIGATMADEQPSGLIVENKTIVRTGGDSNATIQLFTLSGVKIIESREAQIDVSSLPAGLYLYHITTDNQPVTGKLIIK